MPPLLGFSDNPFRNRNDVINATNALVQAIQPYFSTGKARVQLPVRSGAHFDETAAQLEGFARPIWAIAAAAAESSNIDDPTLTQHVERLVMGLANGTDPTHPEYWGPIGDWDQRMVEGEPLSFALLLAPSGFYAPLSTRRRAHLSEWLSGLNDKKMPQNNWRWFRVFSNLTLHRVCGVPYEDVKEPMDKDFALLDRFEIGDGWAADGIWRKDDSGPGHEVHNRQADYYSGSFAIQFSQLLYCATVGELDPDRVSRYLQQARQFASQFWRFFDEFGAPIPFGRSLTYRFAIGAFYAAFAVAGAYDSSNPYTTPGFVKGMLLRHLRWWAANSQDMFSVDGTLTMGYFYPNSFMCENYTSPQSPYWAMKSFVILALGADDSFWTAHEIPHPLSSGPDRAQSVSGVQLLPAPVQILCDHHAGQHHFLLSGGQFCAWPLRAAQAKYSKFAYSSAFGFSVPTGTSLTQLAPDSTLAVSRDGGDTWVTKCVTIGSPQVKTLEIGSQKIQCLQSVWKPWKTSEIEIETTLAPPADEWPDWHIRTHRICNSQRDAARSERLTLVEGGFAIRSNQKCVLPEDWGVASPHEQEVLDGVIENSNSALAISRAGVSGVTNLGGPEGYFEGKILKPDPNTNLIEPRTVIPTVQHEIEIIPRHDAVVSTGVFAIDGRTKQTARQEAFKRWHQQPWSWHDMILSSS